MKWIADRRDELGLNQDELAARLQVEGVEVGRSAVSHWETGRYIPPLKDDKFRVAIAKALRLSVKEVLKRSGFEVVSTHSSEEADRAADIVDQLPPERRDLAIRLLEQLLA